jgi:1-deoxy-D-xylulose-5-phosphate synthase
VDGELVARLCADHDLVVTIEENVLAGGFGAAVLEYAEENLPRDRARILRIGLPDRYVAHGKPALLREEVGLTGPDVAARVLSAIGAREAVSG